MPPQLRRLIPMFAVFIALFLLVRHFLVPDTFGEYGFYRGDALIDIASQEPVLASKDECSDCHWDMREKLDNDMHAGLTCLICHGPGTDHVENPEADNIEKHSGRVFCGRCHQYNAAKSPYVINQIDVKTHHTELDNCIECHNPHEVWEGME